MPTAVSVSMTADATKDSNPENEKKSAVETKANGDKPQIEANTVANGGSSATATPTASKPAPNEAEPSPADTFMEAQKKSKQLDTSLHKKTTPKLNGEAAKPAESAGSDKKTNGEKQDPDKTASKEEEAKSVDAKDAPKKETDRSPSVKVTCKSASVGKLASVQDVQDVAVPSKATKKTSPVARAKTDSNASVAKTPPKEDEAAETKERGSSFKAPTEEELLKSSGAATKQPATSTTNPAAAAKDDSPKEAPKPTPSSTIAKKDTKDKEEDSIVDKIMNAEAETSKPAAVANGKKEEGDEKEEPKKKTRKLAAKSVHSRSSLEGTEGAPPKKRKKIASKTTLIANKATGGWSGFQSVAGGVATAKSLEVSGLAAAAAKGTPKPTKSEKKSKSAASKGSAKKNSKTPSSKAKTPSSKVKTPSSGKRLPAEEVWSGEPDDDLDGGWPEGWTKKTFQRASGRSKGDFDSYWYSPIENKKFRSMNEVRRFLAALQTTNGDEAKAWKMFKGR